MSAAGFDPEDLNIQKWRVFAAVPKHGKTETKIADVVLHDPHGESSNLWGAFDRVRRNLPRIRLHFACKGL